MSLRFGKSSWKDFTKEELEIIEKERNEKPDIEMDSKKQYGIVCPACTKPNSISVNFCTGCSFGTTKKDIQQLPDNVFMNIILGKDSTVPLYRDDHFLVFNDKFGVSENHLDVIPTKVIEDITFLTKEDIPLLKKLYELGLKEFESRNIEKYKGKDLKEFITAGYNYPVSVKHLHLHIVLPPFKHKKVFQYPRWHSMSKVISDLEKYGKVKTYDIEPNDDEGKEEYERAIKTHDLIEQ
eukprot:gene5201-8807_t